jgi:conjugal transfer pilus assembly protein TraE
MKKLDQSFVGKSYSDIVQTKKGYQIAVLSLSLAVGLLSILVMNKNVEVIVMPPDYYEAITVNGDYANEAYAASHAMGIAGMIGNVSERNVEFVTETFLKVLSPYLRSQVEAALNAEAQILKTRRARQTFMIEDVMYEPRNNIVWVWGQKTLTFAGGGTHSERFTYEFRIQPKHGAPRVSHFDAYTGAPNAKDTEYTVDMLPYLSRELKLVKLMANPATMAKYGVTPDPEGVKPTAAASPTQGSETLPAVNAENKETK